ncbi:hypothetical protein D915_010562 [Fasciola hepatica]|uniref:UspA domain-containing protein n=1 Tax=Fasciola hepatica TaxID=6192 RepID=A0A4E0QZ77_FASHE|nr:hypothetical protein D915_010562 [Fasciola hepatica]
MPPILGTLIPISKTSLENGKRLCVDLEKHARNHGFNAKSIIYVSPRPGPAVMQAIKDFHGDLLLLWTRDTQSDSIWISRDLYKHMIKHSTVPITILPVRRLSV